jgi:hypothetical protein
MKNLMTLTKRTSKIDVIKQNGLICFDYGKHREWIIDKDLEKFIQFLNNCGYEK